MVTHRVLGKTGIRLLSEGHAAAIDGCMRAIPADGAQEARAKTIEERMQGFFDEDPDAPPSILSVLHFCRSCSQKRTVLWGESMNEQLLLRLPHRQLIWTLPRLLRVLFRHDKGLHGEISRLVYELACDFMTAAAGKPIRTAAVMVVQSSGRFARWNPHWHGLFLEGGFDREGRFLPAPPRRAKRSPSASCVPPSPSRNCSWRRQARTPWSIALPTTTLFPPTHRSSLAVTTR